MADPLCNGICVMAHEVMEPGTAPMGLVAYAHPECPLHSPVPGDEEDHTDYEEPWEFP